MDSHGFALLRIKFKILGLAKAAKLGESLIIPNQAQIFRFARESYRCGLVGSPHYEYHLEKNIL